MDDIPPVAWWLNTLDSQLEVSMSSCQKSLPTDLSREGKTRYTSPMTNTTAQIRVTDWDDTNGGFIFEVDDHGIVTYIKRFHDGRYMHYDRCFQTVDPPSKIASRREICVASYMAARSELFQWIENYDKRGRKS